MFLYHKILNIHTWKKSYGRKFLTSHLTCEHLNSVKLEKQKSNFGRQAARDAKEVSY